MTWNTSLLIFFFSSCLLLLLLLSMASAMCTPIASNFIFFGSGTHSILDYTRCLKCFWHFGVLCVRMNKKEKKEKWLYVLNYSIEIHVNKVESLVFCHAIRIYCVRCVLVQEWIRNRYMQNNVSMSNIHFEALNHTQFFLLLFLSVILFLLWLSINSSISSLRVTRKKSKKHFFCSRQLLELTVSIRMECKQSLRQFLFCLRSVRPKYSKLNANPS